MVYARVKAVAFGFEEFSHGKFLGFTVPPWRPFLSTCIIVGLCCVLVSYVNEAPSRIVVVVGLTITILRAFGDGGVWQRGLRLRPVDRSIDRPRRARKLVVALTPRSLIVGVFFVMRSISTEGKSFWRRAKITANGTGCVCDAQNASNARRKVV